MRILISLFCLVLLANCGSEKTGQMGPPGPKGERGESGPAKVNPIDPIRYLQTPVATHWSKHEVDSFTDKCVKDLNQGKTSPDIYAGYKTQTFCVCLCHENQKRYPKFSDFAKLTKEENAKSPVGETCQKVVKTLYSGLK